MRISKIRIKRQSINFAYFPFLHYTPTFRVNYLYTYTHISI